MVSIVLVSHSKELSEAVKALADQQIQGRATVVAVGGSDNPHQPFGTDPVAIYEAIEAVYSPDGVLVLMDLGSAVISGRVALDLLEPDRVANVHLSVGPFVEGALAAAVQASIGMSLAAVAREAEEAMQAKYAVLLHEEGEIHELLGSDTVADGHASCDVTVLNPAGLHFGPAARFVQAVAGFQSQVMVTNLTMGTGPADATRFNQLLGLGVEQQHRIRIAAVGPDAEVVVSFLENLVINDVGEPPAAAIHAPPAYLHPPIEADGRAILHGLAASPGIALGAATVVIDTNDLLHTPIDPGPSADPAAEWDQFTWARQETLGQLEALAEQIKIRFGDDQAIIFRAHGLLLDDKDILTEIQRLIEVERMPATAAVQRVFLQTAQHFRTMSGTTFQQRAADIEDVGQRVLRVLRGEVETSIDLPENAIVVAPDLSPSQTARFDRSRLLGFCTAGGGPTSHTAVLARSMGIPAIVGIGDLLLRQARQGIVLAIDGSRGQVVVEPNSATTAAFAQAIDAVQTARQAAWSAARVLTYTRDGARVEVVANLSSAADAQIALEAGAEGVGLLRTEFLFQERGTPPSEEEQFEIYRSVAEKVGERPLIIRTLDIGGDKPAPYLPMPRESNPFLGWRAIRVSLNMPEFFKVQLRALLRAAMYGDVHIMFPMVSTAQEVMRCQAMLATAADELASSSIPHRAGLPTGIMIEVPAAVQIADQLAPLVDFFSIGTNDLTQYTFAADRTNQRVAALAEPLHPAVLRQIDSVIRSAHQYGRWCGLCGELAGDLDAIPILLGMGLDEFSMAPANIPAAKELFRHLTVPVTRRLAQRVLGLLDGDSVRAAVREVIH